MDNSSYILYILSLLIQLIKYAERQWTLLLFLLITKRERGNTQLDLLTKKGGNTHTHTHTHRVKLTTLPKWTSLCIIRIVVKYNDLPLGFSLIYKAPLTF